MIKKLFAIFISVIAAGTAVFLWSCSPSDNFADTWSFDETHHWRSALDGSDEVWGYEEHTGEECSVCGCILQGSKVLIYSSCNYYYKDLCYVKDYDGYDKDVVVPSFHNGSAVIYIGEMAFSGKNIKSIRLADGITGISRQAFSWCSSLKEIILPESLTYIGDSAFEYCMSLETIEFPQSLETISTNAFTECEKLLQSENGITYAGNWAVCADKSLTTATLREGTVGISSGVFEDSVNLADVTMPESLLRIGPFAFSGCSALTSVSIPDNVITIGSYAFSECRALTDIDLGHVATIDTFAFFDCDSLTSAIIPEGVTTIYNLAFAKCDKLETVYLPESLSLVGDGAFFETPLNHVYYAGSEDQWKKIDMYGAAVPEAYGNTELEEANKTFNFNG